MSNLSFNYLSFQINILSGDAKTILTLNRDKIQSEYYPILHKKVFDAAVSILSKHYNELDEELKKYASMFIVYYLNEEERKKLFDGYPLDEWKQLVIDNKTKLSLEKIIQYDSIIINESMHLMDETNLIMKDEHTIEIVTNVYKSEALDFITSKMENNKLRYYTEAVENGKVIYVELKKGNSEVEIDDWETWFKSYIYQDNYSRNLMPCVEEYKELRIKKNCFPRGFGDHTFNRIKKDYPVMICPYIRCAGNGNSNSLSHKLKESVTENLYKMVYDNRYDESVTLEQIKETYQRFLDDTKQYVENFLEKT